MVNYLLAKSAWILDAVFFLILIGGLALGAKNGFIKGVCKIAGLIFSIAVAVMFCGAFANTLESWFGLTSTLADAVNSATIGKWIAVAISFVSLIIIVRLGAWLLGKVGTALVEAFAPLKVINQILGALLGLFEAILLICFLLAICRGLPINSLHEFISDSFIVGKIFNWDWFIHATQISTYLQ